MPPEVKHPSWERIWRGLILAGVLVILAGAPTPHLDHDVPYYGRIAKNIVASSEWIIMRHPVYGVDVPPLTLWLMAISLRVGGDSYASLRLWHLLATIALVFVTYRVARLVAGEEESLLAALLVVTNSQIFLRGLEPKQDIPVTLFLSLSFYAYLRYRQEGRVVLAVWTGVALALAVLSKGVATLPVFGMIVGIDLLGGRWWPGQNGRARWGDGAAGLAAFLLVASPWYVAGVFRQGERFVRRFLLTGTTATRLLRQPRAGGGPYALNALGYIPLLAVGFLPWMGLLPGALREAWRALRTGPHVRRFCAIWVGVVFVVLSLSPGDRVNRYLLPIYVPLAVLAARALRDALETRRGLLAVTAIPLAIAVVLPLRWLMLRGSPRGLELAPYALLLLPPLVGAIPVLAGATVLAARGRARAAVAALAAATLLLFALFEVQVTRHWDRWWPWRPIAGAIAQTYRPGDRVLVLARSSQESNYINYYLEREGAAARDVDETSLEQAWREGGVIAFVPPRNAARLDLDTGVTVLLRTPLGWALITNR